MAGASDLFDRVAEAIRDRKPDEIEKLLALASLMIAGNVDSHGAGNAATKSESPVNKDKSGRDSSPLFDVNANRIGDRRATLVHLAAEYGSTSALDAVVRHGGDIWAKDDEHWTPLHYAAAAGHPNMVAKLLEFFVGTCRLRSEADRDRSALQLAEFGFCDEVYDFVNARDKFGQTPLHLAAEHGMGPCILALLHAGADRAIKDADKQCAADLLRNAAMIAIMGNVHHPKRKEFAESQLGKRIESILAKLSSTEASIRRDSDDSTSRPHLSPMTLSRTSSATTLADDAEAADVASLRRHQQSSGDSGRSSRADNDDDVVVGPREGENGNKSETKKSELATNDEASSEKEIEGLRKEVSALRREVEKLRGQLGASVSQIRADQRALLEKIHRDRKEARDSRKQIVVFFANEIENLRKSQS